MSLNRLIYDNCAYSKRLDESIGPLSYVINPIKYENCKKCRHELGLVGGTAVSHIKGNLVDLENDLRGSTRANSLCPSVKYQPNNTNSIVIKPKYQCKSCMNNQSKCQCESCMNNQSKCQCESCKDIIVDTTLVNLPSCQMINYKTLPEEPKFKIPSCQCEVPQLQNMPVCNCSACNASK